ncbi:MAG: TonB-dependent receptor [Bacteroidetes bacterium]|nr:MAG: TonB-dependent receptor [Bacteroidota bacterium]
MKATLLSLILVCSFSCLSAQRNLRGSVLGEDGTPLIGASVQVKGTTTGAVSDENGRFTLTLPKGQHYLTVSYTGYETQEVKVAGLRQIDIVLKEKAGTLGEVVVTGYSEVESKKLISSIAVVKSEQLENIPMTDVRQLLQGRAAGVYTSAHSGQPGAIQAIRIRGMGSISAGRAPIYVIDGVIAIQGNGANLDAGDNAAALLAQINPNDIETVSVLKDATATALYGSRGANGVIVITTKRGKAGKTEFTAKLQSGVTMPNFGNLNLMTAEQQWNYEREMLAITGYSPAEVDALRPDSLLDNTTNWLEEAFVNGRSQNLEFQARGGNDKTRFFISGGYFDQDGILYLSDFNRYSLRSNFDHTASERLSFTLNTNASYSQQNNAVNGNRFQSPILHVYRTTPMQGKVNPATGKLYTGLEDDWIAAYPDNFLYSLPLNPVEINTFRLLNNLSGTYRIFQDLRFTQTVNVDWVGIDELDYNDPTTGDGRNSQGALLRAFDKYMTLTTQSKLRYATSFGPDHSFDALGVFEYQHDYGSAFGAAGRGFASGKLRTLNSAAEPSWVAGYRSEFSFLSYLAQASYSFKSRYMLTASLRRDGSSRFGANNRWATFWSAGASWLIREEAFLRDWTWLDNLRLRASYGTSGNAAFGDFAALELYGFGGSYQGNPASGPSQIGNPDLTWEVSHSLNIGLDMAFFDNRVSGTVEWYHRQGYDQLYNVPVSRTSGFGSAQRNIGSIRNRGVELTFNLVPVRATKVNGFDWSVDFNVSFNRNRVIDLPDEIDFSNSSVQEGHAFTSFYIPVWAGVNPDDGTPLWYHDSLGVTGNWDQATRQFVGQGEPTMTAGFTNTISFRRFSLSAFFYIAQGNKRYNGLNTLLDSDGRYYGYVHRVEAATDYWTGPGDNASRPQPLRGGNNQSNNYSTRYLEDGSYIRLRNVLLSYQPPVGWLKRIGIQKAMVYAQGQNLLTWTKYSGIDPEAGVGGGEFYRYPVGKSITFGLDVTF